MLFDAKPKCLINHYSIFLAWSNSPANRASPSLRESAEGFFPQVFENKNYSRPPFLLTAQTAKTKKKKSPRVHSSQKKSNIKLVPRSNLARLFVCVLTLSLSSLMPNNQLSDVSGQERSKLVGGNGGYGCTKSLGRTSTISTFVGASTPAEWRGSILHNVSLNIARLPRYNFREKNIARLISQNFIRIIWHGKI